MPSSKDILDKFVAKSPATELNLLSCKRNLKAYIKQQVKLQKSLFKLSETSVSIAELPEFKSKATASTRDNSDVEKEEDKRLTANEIFKTVNANFKEMLPFVEETVDRWNSPTMIIKNLQSGSGAKGKQQSKAFGKTILEQVNSLVNEEESKQRLLEKAHLKREHYRVLGRRADDITQTRDATIYNDFDFY